ncbi:hypothetical protein KSP40_PGU003833 [Platanthera guangdongensis]|uniref:Uncharacterized protein n=1 Tax=Platanthera guangdongensis TaxID=2320717 RepID=A0ABR2LFZ6_9ASPA
MLPAAPAKLCQRPFHCSLVALHGTWSQPYLAHTQVSITSSSPKVETDALLSSTSHFLFPTLHPRSSLKNDHILPSYSSNYVSPTSDDYFSRTFLSSPRPLSFDDPRCSRSHTGGPATRHDMPLNHVDEEAEPLRRIKNVSKEESTSIEAKWSGYNNGVNNATATKRAVTETKDPEQRLPGIINTSFV